MQPNSTRGVAALLSLFLLAGCEASVPVTGASEDGLETFTGTASGGLDGAGTLNIKTSRGMSCEGAFVYATEREGKGTFRCSGGTGGTFEFVSTGTRGTGTGVIGGRRFTFTFG